MRPFAVKILRSLACCLILFAFPVAASAQRTFRDGFEPYNLVCDVSGELGTQRFTLHVEDVQFKLLFLPTLTNNGQPLNVETFDDNSIIAALDVNGNTAHPEIKSIYFDIDRNTGSVSIKYREEHHVDQKTGVSWSLTHEAKGNCRKAARAF
jgi:hypothetical protein